MALLEYIKDQLLFNDVVTLPGLGAFEIVKTPSQIKGKKIIPPSAQVIFNTEKSLDDGVLARSIAGAEEISEDEARQKVLEYIDGILFSLNKGEDYVFEGFGKLYRDSENIFRFERKPEFKIDFESNGLESFELDPFIDIPETELPSEKQAESKQAVEPEKEEPSVKEKPEVKEEIPEAKPEPVMEAQYTAPQKDSKSNRNIFWILTGAVMIILVSFVILKMTTNILEGPVFSIFNSESGDNSEIITEEDDWDLESALNGELGDAIDSMTKQENALSPPESTDPAVMTPAEIQEYSEYHIIAGSFKDMVNAGSLQQELTEMGYPARVIQQGDKLYRVSAMSFTNKGKGLEELSRFKQKTKNNAAWLLGLENK